MNTNPRVSVIIPSYNRAHLIGRAVQSVLNQTYKDFEIIVVDDASTDNTEKVVKSFSDERIRYAWHKENRGGAAARNTGIKIAQGDYIAFLDSDDIWLPEKLEKQIQVFKDASLKVGVVYTGFWRIEGDKKTYIPSSKITQKQGDIYQSLLKRNFIGTPTAMVRKECLLRAGMFDEYLPRLQDWELWIRISKRYHFKCINEPLVISYYQPASISNNQSALIRARELILKKHFEDLKKDRELLAKHYYGIGAVLCSNGELRQGRSYLIKAAKVYPLNIKILLHTFISLLGEATYNMIVQVYEAVQRKFFKR